MTGRRGTPASRWVLVATQLLGLACWAEPRSELSRCFDRSLQDAAAESFRTPIDTVLARQVWDVLVGFDTTDWDWGDRKAVRSHVVSELAHLTGSWRHALLHVATRRVGLPGLHPMLGPVMVAGDLLLSDPRGIITVDSGLAYLAHDIAARQKMTDSTMAALYALTEVAPLASDAKLPQALDGMRTLLCVLAHQAADARWSDTTSAFVGYLVPSLLLLLETNDPTWEGRNSDSVIVEWPDPAVGAAAPARLAELRKLSTIWRSDQTP